MATWMSWMLVTMIRVRSLAAPPGSGTQIQPGSLKYIGAGGRLHRREEEAAGGLRCRDPVT